MKRMTKRERLIAALNRQETDQMPWAPLVDGYFVSSLKEQGLEMDLLQSMRYIGNDILERHVAGPICQTEHVTYRQEQQGDTVRSYMDTPVGSVFQESRATGGTVFQAKHLVETIEDVKVLQYVMEHTTVQPNIQAYLDRAAQIGDDGLPTLTGPVCPLQEMLQSLAGVENTVYLLADYPDEMEAFFHAAHERNKKMYEVLSEYPCPVIIDYEDTSTTVISRSMYLNYTAPSIDDYADIVHGAGKLFITHMCGKLKGFVQEIGRGKMDGVDSVCPPTTGDLCCWDARAAWGDSKVIIGGIEPPALCRMTVEETLHCVAEIIVKMKDQKGFILSTGDAVPYGTPIENMKAVTELINTLGPASLTGQVDPDLIVHVTQKYTKA